MSQAALSLFWILLAVSPASDLDEPALARKILDDMGCRGGLIVAARRLFLSTTGGQVLCFVPRESSGE